MNETKIVYFDQWCPKCEYKDLPEEDDPCDECLAYPAREYSHKPLRFKEKRNQSKGRKKVRE